MKHDYQLTAFDLLTSNQTLFAELLSRADANHQTQLVHRLFAETDIIHRI